MVLGLLVLSIVFSLGGSRGAIEKPNPSWLQGCQTGQEVQMHTLTLMGDNVAFRGEVCCNDTRRGLGCMDGEDFYFRRILWTGLSNVGTVTS